MKLALVIGASRESIYAIDIAKKNGYTVWAFDENPHACGFSHADESYTLDINNIEVIIERLHGCIPNIVLPVPIGRSLISTGKLNDIYNLIGITQRNADLCTDKYFFHQVLTQKKLRTISCMLIQNSNVQNFVWKNFPAILKPRFGAGSRAVKIILNQEELAHTVSLYCPLQEDFIIEDYVTGQEYGVDGAIINGEVAVTLLRKKINTPPPFCQCVGYLAVPKYSHTINMYNSVTPFLSEVISALEITNGLFHADLIYDANNNWFVVEFSPRPSGHNLHNFFTIKCTNIDLVEGYIKYIENTKVPVSYFISENIKPMLIHFFNFENVYIKAIPEEKYLYDKYPLIYYKCNIGKTDFLNSIVDGKSVIDRGFFVLEADSMEKLYDLKDKFLAEFQTGDSLYE